jgi:hypothetical protein
MEFPLTQAVAIVALLGTALVFGTDAFSALVLKPALARVDDAVLAVAMGNVHRFGDRRMPVPGVIGLVASAVAGVLFAVGGHTPTMILAGTATLLWIVWLLLYVRISAPINRRLTAAADEHETPADARALQHGWDSIIWLRATLLGLVVLALAVALIL